MSLSVLLLMLIRGNWRADEMNVWRKATVRGPINPAVVEDPGIDHESLFLRCALDEVADREFGAGRWEVRDFSVSVLEVPELERHRSYVDEETGETREVYDDSVWFLARAWYRAVS